MNLDVTLHGLRLRGETHAADIIESLIRENERLTHRHRPVSDILTEDDPVLTGEPPELE